MEYDKKRRTSLATIVKNKTFNCSKITNDIFKAIDGIGTDEDTIIRIISECNNEQRQLIKDEFQKFYQKELVKELKSELKIRLAVDFKQLLVALFHTPVEYDAICLKAATKGLGTDEKGLVEILLTRTSSHLAKVKEEYQRRFKSSLEDDVADDTSGDFRKFAYTLSRGIRQKNTSVDREKAHELAKSIHVSYSTLKGTDQPRFDFIGLCCSESYEMLSLVFAAYENIAGNDIYQFIDEEFAGDTAAGLKSLVKCSNSTAGYFAEKLHKSMYGLGTDDATLIRIIVSRAEVDLNLIRQHFLAKYDKTLESAIKGDTSGGYRRLLLAIVEGNYEDNECLNNNHKH